MPSAKNVSSLWGGHRQELRDLYRRMRVAFPERSVAKREFLDAACRIHSIRREGETEEHLRGRFENFFENAESRKPPWAVTASDGARDPWCDACQAPHRPLTVAARTWAAREGVPLIWCPECDGHHPPLDSIRFGITTATDICGICLEDHPVNYFTWYGNRFGLCWKKVDVWFDGLDEEDTHRALTVEDLDLALHPERVSEIADALREAMRTDKESFYDPRAMPLWLESASQR